METEQSDLTTVQARVEELRKIINYHNYRYHVLDSPTIGDSEFDALMRELRRPLLGKRRPLWYTAPRPFGHVLVTSTRRAPCNFLIPR